MFSGLSTRDTQTSLWNSAATAAERLLDKPLSLTDRLRYEFGVDAMEDDEHGLFTLYLKSSTRRMRLLYQVQAV
jgi:hypothetical protein